MRNYCFFIALAASAFMAASCQKDNLFTVQKRTPNRVEFQTRVLPEGFVIGSALPESAEAVDLGLSVRWSNMDLGASSSGAFGDLYAWGEITPSGDYGWDSYEHNDHHPDDPYSLYITKYCFDRYGENQDLDRGGAVLDRLDDAACMQWGGDWRMPTAAEITELCEECSWTYSHDSRLFTVTGPNGNSIVIPFEGVGIGTGVYPDGGPAVSGGLWSSTLSENESAFAVQLSLEGLPQDKFYRGVNRGGANRCFGSYVRPVCPLE